MATLQAYLDRKHEEISLLNACRHQPLALPLANSIAAIVTQKFQLAAALKGQYALDNWDCTETAWAQGGDFRSGPFRFRYGYQRADLTVSGPPIYAALGSLPPGFTRRTIYTGCGMAAIAAVLAALERSRAAVEIVALPGSYCEVLELIEGHGRTVRLRPAEKLRMLTPARGSLRLLWLDCCVGAMQFKQTLDVSAAPFDLVLFDTT